MLGRYNIILFKCKLIALTLISLLTYNTSGVPDADYLLSSFDIRHYYFYNEISSLVSMYLNYEYVC